MARLVVAASEAAVSPPRSSVRCYHRPIYGRSTKAAVWDPVRCLLEAAAERCTLDEAVCENAVCRHRDSERPPATVELAEAAGASGTDASP